MNYFIECPHCNQIVEVNYKPRTHKCRCCGKTFKVTSDNSCRKPRTDFLYVISLVALFIGANVAGAVFRGYASETHLIIAGVWIACSAGIAWVTSWFENTIERSVSKYGCKGSKRSVSRTKSNSVERATHTKRI